jgi:hypothetical protein
MSLVTKLSQRISKQPPLPSLNLWLLTAILTATGYLSLSLCVVLCLLRRMTTNQKVAGSSPAERATKNPGFAGEIQQRKRAGQQLHTGDWLIGHEPISRGNKLVYAMKVSEILSFNRYFNDSRFEYKKPYPAGNWQAQCGDNIYHRAGNVWTQEWSLEA